MNKKKVKELEQHFDDCGADLTPITSYLAEEGYDADMDNDHVEEHSYTTTLGDLSIGLDYDLCYISSGWKRSCPIDARTSCTQTTPPSYRLDTTTWNQIIDVMEVCTATLPGQMRVNLRDRRGLDNVQHCFTVDLNNGCDHCYAQIGDVRPLLLLMAPLVGPMRSLPKHNTCAVVLHGNKQDEDNTT